MADLIDLSSPIKQPMAIPSDDVTGTHVETHVLSENNKENSHSNALLDLSFHYPATLTMTATSTTGQLEEHLKQAELAKRLLNTESDLLRGQLDDLHHDNVVLRNRIHDLENVTPSSTSHSQLDEVSRLKKELKYAQNKLALTRDQEAQLTTLSAEIMQLATQLSHLQQHPSEPSKTDKPNVASSVLDMKRIQYLQSQLDLVKLENDQLRDLTLQDRQIRDQIIAELESSLAHSTQQLTTAHADLEGKTRLLNSLQSNLGELEEEKKSQHEQLEQALESQLKLEEELKCAMENMERLEGEKCLLETEMERLNNALERVNAEKERGVSEHEHTLNALESELQHVRDENTALDRQLSDLKQHQDQLLQQNQSLQSRTQAQSEMESEIANLTTQITQLESDLNQSHADLAEARKRNGELAARVRLNMDAEMTISALQTQLEEVRSALLVANQTIATLSRQSTHANSLDTTSRHEETVKSLTQKVVDLEETVRQQEAYQKEYHRRAYEKTETLKRSVQSAEAEVDMLEAVLSRVKELVRRVQQELDVQGERHVMNRLSSGGGGGGVLWELVRFLSDEEANNRSVLAGLSMVVNKDELEES